MTCTRLNPESSVGTVKSIWPEGKSIANSTTTDAGSVSLEAGKWVVDYGGSFAANATGQRVVACGTSDSALNSRQAVRTRTCDSGETKLCGSIVFTLSATSTVRLYVWQNGGGSLTFYGWMTAVKIA